jgi:hypothetical protein
VAGAVLALSALAGLSRKEVKTQEGMIDQWNGKTIY